MFVKSYYWQRSPRARFESPARRFGAISLAWQSRQHVEARTTEGVMHAGLAKTTQMGDGFLVAFFECAARALTVWTRRRHVVMIWTLIARQKGLVGNIHPKQLRVPPVLPFANPITDRAVKRSTEAFDEWTGRITFYIRPFEAAIDDFRE